MKKTAILIIILLVTLVSQAQRIPVYNLYNTNRYLINPAKTGSDGALSAMLNSRSQWSGFEGAPRTTTFGVHGKLLEQMGLGLILASDKRGIFETTTAELNYSYTIKITDEQMLSFGVSGGLLQTNVNRSKASGVSMDYNDPALFDDYLDKASFEGGAGIAYNWQGLELAISSPKLFTLNRHFIGLGSYAVQLSEAITFMPAISYQIFPESPDQFDAMMLLDYRKTVWIQGTYRSNQNVIAALGINLKQMGIAYAYEINSGALTNFSNGSHEVAVTFNFGENVLNYQKKKKDEELKSLENEQNKNDEMFELKNKVNQLEQRLELERRIQELEKEIDELKKKDTEAFIEMEDSVMESTDKIVEIGTNDDRQKNNTNNAKVETDETGFAIAKGNYVVIYTVNNPESAKNLVKMTGEKDIKTSIAYNKSKGYYYIYTYYSADLNDALTVMQEWRQKGFEKAWVCVLK